MKRLARVGSLALTVLVAAQQTLRVPSAHASSAEPRDAGAISATADSWADPTVADPTIRTAESSGCGIAVTSTGGMLSSCPDVADLADFDARLPKALDALRDTTRTSPLTVRSDPPGATVTLNGSPLGVTPYQGTVRPGSYLVRIEKEGYGPFSHVITVAADAPVTLEKTLDLLGGRGTSQPVPGATLLGLLGPDVVEDGELYVQQLVRDRDGRYYAAFTNNVERRFPKPDIGSVWPDIGENYIGTYGSDLYYPRTQAVAVSADDGRTWSLVAKWVDDDTWTLSAAGPFEDADWNKGTPNPPDHTQVTRHWVRIAYEAHTTLRYRVGAIVPRLDGGVTIHVWKSTRDQREIQGLYDNLPASWCRADDPDFGKKNTYCTATAPKDVYRYINRDYLTWKEPDDLDLFHEQRFGMTKDDLATWDDTSSELSAYEMDGSSKLVVKPGIADFDNHNHILSLLYIGRYEDPDTKVAKDYFFQYQKADLVRPCSAPAICDYVYQPALGTISTSTDGGRSLTLLEQFSDADAKVCNDDVLLCEVDAVLGPKGAIYVRDQDGAVAIVEPGGPGTATLRRLGNGFPKATAIRDDVTFRVDAAGNGHEVFTFPNRTATGGVDVYEQYFAATPLAYADVELVTTGECPACDASAAYLTAAGVPFNRSPRPELYPDDAYPVLLVTRNGTPETILHASPSAISRSLGLSYPAIVANEQTRFADAYLQDGEIRIVVRGNDGITALGYADGRWNPTRLTQFPGDGFFNLMWSGSPYGNPGATSETAGSMPYAYIVATSGKQVNGDWWQDDNQLWTSKEPDTTESFTAVSHASQLIPATAFDIYLPDGANAGAVEGELAPYITSQAVVGNGPNRVLRVVVDLRNRHETAVMSTIVSRVIGGSVSLTVPQPGGSSEERVLGLLLLVENTPLRATDPTVPGKAIDISTEAVLFRGGGADATSAGQATKGTWIVTNNLSIANSIPCGDSRSIEIAANSVTTLSTDEVGQKGLGSCLDAIESAPTVITGCESWADAQLVLAADTIDSLRASLPLTRVAGVTNWELAFKTRDATIHRIVTLDKAVVAEATGRCASEVDANTAAVVEISGRILGDGEPFKPTITIVKTGDAATVVAPTDDPEILAWERHFLDIEAGFLQAALSVGEAEQPLWETINRQWSARQDEYEAQLLATRALLHCNNLGESVASVQRLMDRRWYVVGADLRARSCLLDFILAPGSFWAGDPDNLPESGASLAGSLHAALVRNPTLAFLVAATTGPKDYARFLLGWADQVDTKQGGLSTAYALDVVNRLLTSTGSEMTGPRGRLQQLILLADPLERAALRAVIACGGTSGAANPFPKLYEATSTNQPPSGLPCLGAVPDASGDPFKLLAIGLRSGPYDAIARAAGADLDLLHRYLVLAGSVLDEVELAEKVYPPGTLVSALDTPAKLSPVARFVILRDVGTSLRATLGSELTAADVSRVASGVRDCGLGFVKGLASTRSLLSIGAGVAASGLAVFLGAPAIGVAVGAYFFVDGLKTTYEAGVDVAKRFESLDLQAKSAGICGVAAGVLMTVGGGKGLNKDFQRLRSPKELAKDPPTVIAEDELPTEGGTAAATFEEQADVLAAEGTAIVEPEPEPPVPSFDAELDAAIGGLDAAEQPLARDIADQLGYIDMTDAEKKVARQVLALPADARLRSVNTKIALDLGSQADKAAWKSVGRAIATATARKPKSIVIDLAPAHPAAPISAPQVVGADAALVGAASTGTSVEVVEAALASPRTSRVLADLGEATIPATALATPEEAGWLTAVRAAGKPDDPTVLISNVTGRAFASMLKRAVYTAQQLLKGSGDLTTVDVSYLAKGAQRTVFKLVGKGKDQEVPLVAKLGPQPAEAVAFQREQGELGLSARVLADPIADIDGRGNSLSVEEFLPGEAVDSVFFEPNTLPKATIDLATVKALARYMYDQYRLTKERYGTAKIGIDDHLGNLQRIEDGTVKSLEADLQFARDVTEEQFFAIELLRRSGGSEFGAWLLPGDAMVPYIGEFLALWAEERGADGARQFLERIQADLADASFREGVFKIQDRSFAEFHAEDGTPFHVPPDFESLSFLERVAGNLTTEIKEALRKYASAAPLPAAAGRLAFGELPLAA